MATIKPGMTMNAIQKILDKGGDIVFQKGQYKITKTLWLSSNSNIECEEGVMFIKKCNPSMFMTRVDENTTKYRGAHDIRWAGGEIISDVKSKTQSNLFTIVHARYVEINGLSVRRSYSPHCIEINASRDVQIVGCSFTSHTPPKEHKEVIQIDFANFKGLTYAPANASTYDGTHCKDILVYQCNFKNVGHAIGTHTVCHGDGAHQDIRIINNTYDGRADGIFVKLLNMRKVRIAANMINTADVAIKLNALKTETLEHGGTVKVENPKKNAEVSILGNTFFKECVQEVMVV